MKPECISALTARASARRARSAGHSAGTCSATYSQMASESQTTVSPSIRQGTLPEGECLRISLRVLPAYKRTPTSSKATPACLSASQGRRLQEE